MTTAGQPTAGSAEVVTLKGGFNVLPALNVRLPAGATVPPVVPQRRDRGAGGAQHR